MKRARFGLVVGVSILVLVGAACSSDGKDDDNGDVSITSFDVPSSADCSGAETGTVEVSWETDGATEVQISVDGDPVASGPDPSGTNEIDVPCDGEDHDIELTADDGDGKSASQTETVSTEASSGSGDGSTTTTGGGTTTSHNATTTTQQNDTSTTGSQPTEPDNGSDQ